LLFDFLHLDLITIVARLLVIVTALSFHEFAHAFVAYKLGDDTAYRMGRITLNPLAHLDPIGTIMILLLGFGGAKPVEVNPLNFKNHRKGMAAVAVAGPLSNFLLAFITFIIARIVIFFAYSSGNITPLFYTIIDILSIMAGTNISLGVFNLLPIPPLDGSKVLGAFVAQDFYYKMISYQQQSYTVLLFLMASGIATPIIRFFSIILFDALYYMSGFVDIIFKLFT
jgi:Zn-dependent proteases